MDDFRLIYNFSKKLSTWRAVLRREKKAKLIHPPLKRKKEKHTCPSRKFVCFHTPLSLLHTPPAQASLFEKKYYLILSVQ
jgi:hypothetical protein